MDAVPSFGCRIDRQINKRKKYALAIGGRRSNILHTTTNQKQVATTEGSMEGRCNEGEVRGKHNTIMSGGALELMEVKT